MPSVRDAIIPVLSGVRIQVLDQTIGLRRYALYRRTRTPSDGRGGVGCTWTVVDTPLPTAEKPGVKLATQKDIVASGGRIKAGDFLVDGITRPTSTGTNGTPPTFFRVQPSAPGQQVLFVLAPNDPNDGDDVPAYVAGPPPSGGAECTLSFLDATKMFTLRLVLTPATGRR